MLELEQSTAQHAEQVYHISRLSFDDLELLIPQDDVVSVESVYELNTKTDQNKFLGYIPFQSSRIPVYSLSASLELMPFVADNRAQCVVVKYSGGWFALLCQEIRNFQLTDIRFEPVPACMNHSAMPLTHLALYSNAGGDRQLGLVSHADLIMHYIEQL